MVYTLRFFFSSQCSLFHNCNLFGSCIIHTLYTGVLKLNIYSANIGTEYFKHGIYTLRFFLFAMQFFHNCNLFGSCIIHILYTGCAKIKQIFIQQIWVLNILNMLYTLLFSLFKMQFVS